MRTLFHLIMTLLTGGLWLVYLFIKHVTKK